MGWLGVAGAGGRMLGPVIAMRTLALAGTRTLFVGSSALFASAALLVLHERARLQQLGEGVSSADAEPPPVEDARV